jgi:hypothetical protein
VGRCNVKDADLTGAIPEISAEHFAICRSHEVIVEKPVVRQPPLATRRIVADICAADGVAREDIAQPCGTLARNAKYDRSTMTVGAVWIQQAVANKSVACGTNSDDCKRGIPYCVVEDPAARGAQLRCLPSCLEAKKGPPSSTPAAARARGTCRGGAVRWVRGRRHRRRGRCRPRHCNLQLMVQAHCAGEQQQQQQ